MDNLIVVAHSLEECDRVIRRTVSFFQVLGIQDVSRKRRQVNQGGKPWAGLIVIKTDNKLFASQG